MLVQICPPGAGGVRDYADGLAQAWLALGVASQVIEAIAPTRGELALAERLRDLARQRGADGSGRLVVVLHFSGYGYARRGLCSWLVDELRGLSSTDQAGVRLIVVFHELYASGPPWRSAFWLMPIQRRIARRLAAVADVLWTNTAHHARLLRDVDRTTPMDVRPVFSNVGEPVHVPAWDARSDAAVVFGSAATRARAFARLADRGDDLRRLGVRMLVEVGPGDTEGSPRPSLPVRRLGHLSVSAVGEVLLGARFGIIDYPAPYLGKSGVFAAYAAHGCVAIDTCAADPAGDVDGLSAGRHYLALDDRQARTVDFPEMSRKLRDWYAGHTLARQARELLALARAAAA